MAANLGHHTIVELLVKHGAQLNLHDDVSLDSYDDCINSNQYFSFWLEVWITSY